MFEDNDNSMSSYVSETGNRVTELEKALDEEKARASRYLENWQRTQADFENYRKRNQVEQCESIRLANSAICADLLPVLDDFERALNSIPPESRQQPWVEGVRLIYNKFKSVLESQGLCEIKAGGEAFDPCLHEAVMQAEGDENKVVSEVRKGYKFFDKIIRPSLVVVGKGRKEKTES